jgi:hypothetical protein
MAVCSTPWRERSSRRTAERVFEVRDRLADGGLRQAQTARGFSYAAGFDHDHQDIEVAQFDPALDTIIPRHRKHPSEIGYDSIQK